MVEYRVFKQARQYDLASYRSAGRRMKCGKIRQGSNNTEAVNLMMIMKMMMTIFFQFV
jgi:hypothetical protein